MHAGAGCAASREKNRSDGKERVEYQIRVPVDMELAPQVSVRMTNPATAIMNQPKAACREKTGRRAGNNSSR